MRPEVRDRLVALGIAESALDGLDNAAIYGVVLAHVLLPGERAYTIEEVAALAGTTPEVAQRTWLALGLPDQSPYAFTHHDVEGLREAVALAGDGGADEVIERARIVGAAMAAVADFSLHSQSAYGAAARAAGMAPEEVAMGMAERIDAEGVARLLDYVHRRLVTMALRRHLRWSDSPGAAEQRMAVGFADLSGFTALSERLSALDLEAVAGRFEALTRDIVAGRDGRVIKAVGDAVLFVAASPAAAVGMALRIVEVVSSDPALLPVRVGVDVGPVVLRDGDVFGLAVNRASRIVGVAPPGSVVASVEVVDALGAALSEGSEPLGPLLLKDFGPTQLWALRPVAP